MKEFVEKIIDRLRQAMLEEEVVTYTIEDYDNKKFLVKCKGLFCYVPFSQMPWGYEWLPSWQAIAPSILGKAYKGHVTSISQGNHKVFLSSKAFTFHDYVPILGIWYQGIILSSRDYGVFVDIGNDDGFRSYSMIGLVHYSKMPAHISPSTYKIGDQIKVEVLSYDSSEAKLELGLGYEVPAEDLDPLSMLGEITEMAVIKTGARACSFMIDGYSATIKKAYLPDGASVSSKRLVKLKRRFKGGEILSVHVKLFSKHKKQYSVEWVDAPVPVPAKKSINPQYVQMIASKYPYEIGDVLEVNVNASSSGYTLVTHDQYRVSAHILIDGVSVTQAKKQEIMDRLDDHISITVTITDFLKDAIQVDWNYSESQVVGWQEEE